jgi:hypothetical protein
LNSDNKGNIARPKPNTSNTSANTCAGGSGRRKANAYTVVLDFLDNRPIEKRGVSPVEIAAETGLNYSTVRGAIAELVRDDKIYGIPRGKFVEYQSNRGLHDEFSRLIKTFPPNQKERYHVHGLTMKLTAQQLGLKTFPASVVRDISNTSPLGGGGGVHRSGRVRVGFKGSAGLGTGETSFQLSKRTLMVWCSCTNLSMDFDAFMVWLSRVDGFLAAKNWPRLDGNLRNWHIVQFGLNKDRRAWTANKLVKSVTLQGFESWYAEIYEKKLPSGKEVLRTGIHSTDDKTTMYEMVGLLNGDLSRVQAEQALEGNTDALNTTRAVLGEVCKQVGQLKDKLYKSPALKMAGQSDDQTELLKGIAALLTGLTQKVCDLDKKVTMQELAQQQPQQQPSQPQDVKGPGDYSRLYY